MLESNVEEFRLKNFNNLRVVLVLPFAKESKEVFFILLCVLFGIRGQSLKCLEVKEFASQLDVAAGSRVYSISVQ